MTGIDVFVPAGESINLEKTEQEQQMDRLAAYRDREDKSAEAFQKELALQESCNELERKLIKCTARLEEAHVTLRLMMRKEEEVEAKLEKKILDNVKHLVLPFVRKLKTSKLDSRQKTHLDILESNLNEIISPFVHSAIKIIPNMTPGEIQIANFVKDGKDTKEIAELLALSPRTIDFHRANIREKLGIKKKKKGLRSHLMSLG